MRDKDPIKILFENNPKLIGWGIILGGLFFGGVGCSDPSKDVGIMLIISGAIMILGGIIAIIFTNQITQKRKNERLNQIFYDVIRQNKGEISVIQFAIASNLDVVHARAFIEEKAIQLSTSPEINDDGTIIYTFR